MKKPYIVNIVYSILLIDLAVFGFTMRYLEQGDVQYTALIPAVFGLILLPLTRGLKRENRVVGHIAASVLILVLFGMISMIFRDGGLSLERKNIIFQLIAIFTLYYIYIDIRYFVRRRKGLEI